MPRCLFNAIRTHRWPTGPCFFLRSLFFHQLLNKRAIARRIGPRETRDFNLIKALVFLFFFLHRFVTRSTIENDDGDDDYEHDDSLQNRQVQAHKSRVHSSLAARKIKGRCSSKAKKVEEKKVMTDGPTDQSNVPTDTGWIARCLKSRFVDSKTPSKRGSVTSHNT